MAPGPLEQRKRKEIVMTKEEAAKKKLPKGYAYEPILPAEPVPPVDPLQAEREARKRRADSGRALGSPSDAPPLNGLHAKHSNLSISIPEAASMAIASGAPLTHQERSNLKTLLQSEVEALQRVIREIEGKEWELGALNGGSDAGAEGRKRVKRSDEVLEISPPGRPAGFGELGFGEGLGPNGTPLPKLRHSSSFQMSAGDSAGAGGMTPKRTPKANTAYINPDFISGQDKIPPQEKAKSKSAALKKTGSSAGLNGGKAVDANDPKRQRIEAARGRRMGEILKQCQTVLKKAMSHKYSWVFNKPVDIEGMGLHDYLTIIKTPMDLGTINQRLKDNHYQHPEEFHADVDLVWSNAMTYNQPGSDVHIMAAELRKVFEEAYRRITTKLEEDAVKRQQEEKELKEWNPARENKEVQELQRRLQALENQVVAQAAAAQRPKARSASAPKPKPTDKNKREMTYSEKQKLSQNLGRLTPDKLERVLQIISLNNPNFGNGQQGEEIELDIDSLDVDTLWELDRYVLNCMKSKGKGKKGMGVDSGGMDAPTAPASSVPAAESSKARDGGSGEDSVDIEDVPQPGAPASTMSAHKDAHSTKSEDTSSTSGSSDDSSSSSGSDSGSESGSDSDGDEAQSKDVASRPKGPGSTEPGKGNEAGVAGPTSPAAHAAGVSGQASGGEAPADVTGSDHHENVACENLAAKASDTSVAKPSIAQSEEPTRLDDEKSIQAALLKKKYADIILKAQAKGITAGPVVDPKTRKEMERKQREERAKIEADARAAEEAAKRRAEEAAAASRKKREEEREAERRRLMEMEKTVDIDEDQRVKEFQIFTTSPAQHAISRESRGTPTGAPMGFEPFAEPGGNALETFGLELAESDDEDNASDNDDEVEEGEI